KAIKIGDIKDEFELIKEGGVVFFEAGKAVAIVAETNADADTKTVVGLLTAVRELRGGGFEFRVKVAGSSETYVTESTKADLPEGIEEDTIVKLTVGEKSNKVVVFTEGANKGKIAIEEVQGHPVTVEKVSGRTLTVTGGVYGDEYGLIDGFKVYDAEDDYSEIKNVRDLVGRKAKLYFDGASKYYVSYVIADEKVETPASDAVGTLKAAYKDGDVVKVQIVEKVDEEIK
ncbi:hypothetical protein SRI86_20130, partial [Clostridioides difficile]|uniref:hypothetical protein n=1 Tax=Clostridioides difficile TaxID=1496 RepID=UPI002A91BDBB